MILDWVGVENELIEKMVVVVVIFKEELGKFSRIEGYGGSYRIQVGYFREDCVRNGIEGGLKMG